MRKGTGVTGLRLKLGLGLVLLVVLGWVGPEGWAEVRKVVYVIPPGTGQRIAAGQATVGFPDEIILTLALRDTLIIENQDDVVHTFGPFVVAPHATLTKRFDRPVVYEGACTFHQDQQMRLVVNPAPWDIFR